MITKDKKEELIDHSIWIRKKIITMVINAGYGHIGGSLSCVDILCSLYLGKLLNVNPNNISANRDRYIHSKGHACEVMYATLARAGFIEESILETYGKDGSILGGHVDSSIPGIELSTGSLGNGLGIGCGIAYGAKLLSEDYKTIVMLGDGECFEGAVWEAAQFANHHQLTNLIAIIDRNLEITLDYTEDCNALEPFAEKWIAYGWNVISINGHDFSEIFHGFQAAKENDSFKPSVIIASTVKGKGVSFMEKNLGWHHKVPSYDQYKKALAELNTKSL